MVPPPNWQGCGNHHASYNAMHERSTRRMWGGRDLSLAGPGRESALHRLRARRREPAHAADAAGHPEPRPIGGRNVDLPSPPQTAYRHLQGRGHGLRSLPHEPSHPVRGPDEGIRRPGGDRPRPLRHLRRRRPQLRPAFRASAHQEAQVVQLRLQRPIGELLEAAQRTSGRRQQPSGPRDRHRGLHAPDLHGADRRPAAAADRRHAADRRPSSTAPTAWSFSTPWAT